ncbi:putative reverse transcriptase domain-containing protein [Tanacetum coccineum]
MIRGKNSRRAAGELLVKLRFKLLFGLRPLKNSLEDGQGLDDLMDTQTTWIQRDYKEIRVDSRNAVVLITARRNTRSSTANNTNPLNETADEETEQIKERPYQAAVSKHLGLLVPRNFSAQKYAARPRFNLVEYPCSNPRTGAAIAQSWDDFKKLLMEEYYPDDEVQKLELEFWNHKMVKSDIDGYTTRFHELAKLVPHMVTPESQRVNRYIRGLAPEIKPHVTLSKPTTIQGVVSMANRLTTNGIKDGLFKKKENAGNKRRSNDQNKNRGRDDRNKRQRTGGDFALTIPEQGQGQRRYAGQHPKCAKCNFHHSSNYPVCRRCNQVGHFTQYCMGRAANE